MGQECDILVIGGGGAALRAAIAAHESAPGRHVVLVTKGKLGQSGVTATACSDRMAFHATLPSTEPGGPNAWRYHAEDIYRIGGCVSDADLAEVLAHHAAEAFDYLDWLGVPFTRRADGTVDQFVTDGSKYARACYTGPHTANHIHAALLGRFRELGLEAWEQTMVAELLPAVGGQRVAGALLVDERSGGSMVVRARAVVLATGGAGAAFAVNVFPDDCTGDGYALAYRAGAQLVNLEFIQIGLSSVKTKLACSGSMMRALPRLVNNCDEEFLSHYFAPDTPMSQVYNVLFAKGASWPVSLEEPSHRIDIAVERERAAGQRIFLDFSRNSDSLDWEALDPTILRWYREAKGVDFDEPALRQSPLHRLEAINPQSVAWLQKRGIDLEAGERVEIAPAIQHFQGGVKIRIHGETTLSGLYAAGEVAGGQHGANRPGGNALLDCQVFGRIAGESAAQTAAELVPLDESALVAAVSGLTEEGGSPAAEVRAHAQRIVADAAGVVRTELGLQTGLKALAALRAEGLAADEHGLSYAVETRNILDVAELVMKAALHRDESRGPHLRFASSDATEPIPRDDCRWQRYIVIQRGIKGAELRAEEPGCPLWEQRE
jgi:succinate dehydrogenase/fumarate reductase flavoprotein subunit